MNIETDSHTIVRWATADGQESAPEVIPYRDPVALADLADKLGEDTEILEVVDVEVRRTTSPVAPSLVQARLTEGRERRERLAAQDDVTEPDDGSLPEVPIPHLGVDVAAGDLFLADGVWQEYVGWGDGFLVGRDANDTETQVPIGEVVKVMATTAKDPAD